MYEVTQNNHEIYIGKKVYVNKKKEKKSILMNFKNDKSLKPVVKFW